MQLGHESLNRLQPTVDQQQLDEVQPHGRRAEKNDSRLLQLDLMIRGHSQVMRDLKKSILRAADCRSTVLITSESGTRKELVARAIHDGSLNRYFVRKNEQSKHEPNNAGDKSKRTDKRQI